MINKTIYFLLFLYLSNCIHCGHIATKRLYEDVLSDYNRLIRPVNDYSNKLVVNISLKLTQLLDIRKMAFDLSYPSDFLLNMKQQVMSTNVWVEQSWIDYKLQWDPDKYEGVKMINVPAENIWQPDIVLFNNADGNYEVTLLTKALIYYTGEVIWKPPALFRSTCEIDVQWFPFDIQSCLMKFGSWTYDGNEVDLRHVKQEGDSNTVDVGIDMSDFYTSVEWDILQVPAKYNNEYFDCCPEPFPDITFNLTMRRKTLFYTVNLIVPVVGISFLTLLVFYLPSDSGEKVTLSISILVSLTVFFLLLAEIIPPTSLAVPLLGKYLLFTMILVTFSICVTVGVLNIHFRSPSTHTMSPWVRSIFIEFMPTILFMKRPSSRDLAEQLADISGQSRIIEDCEKKKLNSCERYTAAKTCFHGYGNRDEDIPGLPLDNITPHNDCTYELDLNPSCFSECNFPDPTSQIRWTSIKKPIISQGVHQHNFMHSSQYSPQLRKAIDSILLIADHLKKEDEEISVIEDWKFMATVLDRFFLWIFSIACIVGTFAIILQAPSLYNNSTPIDAKLSQIGR